MRIESLNKPITDSEGNLTELGDLIADNKAIDLDAWLDIRTFLLGCPQRLIDIAEKRRDGVPLNRKEKTYLDHYRERALKKSQKTLF